MPPLPIRLGLTALCALVPAAAFADPTAEQAQSLQQQLRGWLEQSFGAKVTLPVEVAPEGDHYRVSLRIPDFFGISYVQGGGTISLAISPMPAGRWLLADYRIASPIKVKVDLGSLPSNAGAGSAGPFETTMNFDKTDLNGIFDPTFATPSEVTTRIGGLDFTTEGGQMRQSARADGGTGKVSIIPAGNNRIDITGETAAENFSSATKAAGQPAVAVFMGAARQSLQIRRLDPERARQAIRSLVQLANSKLGAGPPGQAPNGAAEQPKVELQSARDLYTMLRGIVGGGEFSETLEDLRAEAGGHVVDLGRIRFAGGIETPGGMLTAHLALALDGIASPDIPPEARAYIPRHVAVHPRLSGISLADLDALIMAATRPGVQPSLDQPEIAQPVAAMFAHGGITAGVDEFEIDLGATRLGAKGKVTALSPDQFKGEAEVAAIGFDALVESMQGVPDLAKAAPFLQLLGKIGRADGPRIVWVISGDNTNLKVNGLDVAALVAASKAGSKPQ